MKPAFILSSWRPFAVRFLLSNMKKNSIMSSQDRWTSWILSELKAAGILIALRSVRVTLQRVTVAGSNSDLQTLVMKAIQHSSKIDEVIGTICFFLPLDRFRLYWRRTSYCYAAFSFEERERFFLLREVFQKFWAILGLLLTECSPYLMFDMFDDAVIEICLVVL